MSIERVNNDLCVGEYRHLVVSVARNAATSAGMRALLARLEKVARSYPQQQVILNVLEPSVAIPSEQERKAMAAALRTLAERHASSLVVFEATGFVSAAVRAAMAGISFFSAQAQKVFRNVEEAAVYVAAETPEAGREAFRAGLVREVGEVRRVLHAQDAPAPKR